VETSASGETLEVEAGPEEPLLERDLVSRTESSGVLVLGGASELVQVLPFGDMSTSIGGVPKLEAEPEGEREGGVSQGDEPLLDFMLVFEVADLEAERDLRPERIRSGVEARRANDDPELSSKSLRASGLRLMFSRFLGLLRGVLKDIERMTLRFLRTVTNLIKSGLSISGVESFARLGEARKLGPSCCPGWIG
jgi:hypothetical protein